MVTMMQHPKHGRHPALGHEIAALTAAGWTKIPPKAVQAPPAPTLEITAVWIDEAPPEPAKAAQQPPAAKPKPAPRKPPVKAKRAYNRKPKA